MADSDTLTLERPQREDEHPAAQTGGEPLAGEILAPEPPVEQPQAAAAGVDADLIDVRVEEPSATETPAAASEAFTAQESGYAATAPYPHSIEAQAAEAPAEAGETAGTAFADADVLDLTVNDAAPDPIPLVDEVAAPEAQAPMPAEDHGPDEAVDLTAVKQAMMELSASPSGTDPVHPVAMPESAPEPDLTPAPAPEANEAPAAEAPTSVPVEVIVPAAAVAVAAAAAATQASAPADEPAPADAGQAPDVEAPPSPGTIGVLLVNLGTPDKADAKAVRRYLREFLSDRRVIENDGLLWKFVLNWIVLPFRPRIKARAYRKIWNTERDESPLRTITRAQAEKLGELMSDVDSGIVVDWAMRYGTPSVGARFDALIARGCERVLLMPLYPQYSASTTATVNDVVFRRLLQLRKQPALRVLPPYYDDTVYIEALASSIEAHLAAIDLVPDVIVASFHGMPRIYVEKGDPYERHCIETTRLLRERLGLDEDKLVMTFQSRFGRGKWLEPATDRTIKKLGKSGVKSIAVVTPGFAADCLETLEEIAIENAHIFKKAGGERFTAVPCLNDSEHGMMVLRQAALRELKGWI